MSWINLHYLNLTLGKLLVHAATQTLIYVPRVRRALALQTGDEDSTCPKVLAPTRRGACSKSVGDLNLSGASLQSAACANLSRSADWPASSAACIRKRTVSALTFV